MKINEGYKSAVNRYNSLTNSDDGRNFVSMLNHLGIPREHLLWAVERIEGEGINVHVFIQMYKEWKKYVFPYCEKQNIDIPNITQQTFQQMCTMIDTSKRYWAFPNVVYNHNGIIVCKLNTYMDAHMLPIETTWCITKIPRRFEEFCGEGKDGYYIVNNSAQEPYQRTLAIIMNGEVEYWDSNNKRMAELPDYIARFKEYEALLPKEVKEIFYSDAAKQGEQIEQQNNKTDKNESKIMSKKNTIRLTESDLKRVISESVKSILNEYNSNPGNITPTEDERNFRNGYASIYEGIELLEKVNFENLIDIHGKTPREIRVKQSIGENEVYILKDDIREIRRIIQKWGHYINSILPLFRKPNGDGTYSWTE